MDEHTETELVASQETPEVTPWWRKRRIRWVALIVVVLAIVILVVAITTGGFRKSNSNNTAKFTQPSSGKIAISESEAVKEGKMLANNQCKGEGVPYKLSVSPMKPEEFSIVVPYGLMVGGHVTPIDHQYFSPKDYKSQPDAYEVRAMADSTIVDISSRPRPFGHEYRLVFSVSCTFLYYYDLVTSLTPDIQKAYDEASSNTGSRKQLIIPVKANQLIGRIGGQTLDFAVWDTTKPLSGFVEPSHYGAERWKIFTADPLNYYTDELKAFILSRYARKIQPISGKIDYDEDGKLVGNWFLKGTNGYEGDRKAPDGAYWKTHLSFSPNLYVPDWFVVSIGDFENPKEGLGAQFVAAGNAPNPKEVTVETGLIKYELMQWSYTKEGGAPWDQNSVPSTVSIRPNTDGVVRGCALVQMIGKREIKFEATKGIGCKSIGNFTGQAKTYVR